MTLEPIPCLQGFKSASPPTFYPSGSATSPPQSLYLCQAITIGGAWKRALEAGAISRSRKQIVSFSGSLGSTVPPVSRHGRRHGQWNNFFFPFPCALGTQPYVSLVEHLHQSVILLMTLNRSEKKMGFLVQHKVPQNYAPKSCLNVERRVRTTSRWLSSRGTGREML